MLNDTLPWAVQKWLNQSICHLGCEFRWTKRSLSSIGVTWWIRLKRPSEPIEMPFGLWTRVGWRKCKFSCIRQVAPMCPHGSPHGRAHCRHLVTTIEPSICGGDAALCLMSNYFDHLLLVHGQVTSIFVVCLSVCLCRVFLSRLWSDFIQTRTYVICLCLVVSPRI